MRWYRCSLYTRPTRLAAWIVIVIAHWNNSQHVDLLLHIWFDPTTAWTLDLPYSRQWFLCMQNLLAQCIRYSSQQDILSIQCAYNCIRIFFACRCLDNLLTIHHVPVLLVYIIIWQFNVLLFSTECTDNDNSTTNTFIYHKCLLYVGIDVSEVISNHFILFVCH